MTAVGFSDSDGEDDTNVATSGDLSSDVAAMVPPPPPNAGVFAGSYDAYGYPPSVPSSISNPAAVTTSGVQFPPSASGIPFNQPMPYTSASTAAAMYYSLYGVPPTPEDQVTYAHTSSINKRSVSEMERSDYYQFGYAPSGDPYAYAGYADAPPEIGSHHSSAFVSSSDGSSLMHESISNSGMMNGYAMNSNHSAPSTAPLGFGASLGMRPDGTGEVWLSGPPPKTMLNHSVRLRKFRKHRQLVDLDEVPASTKSDWICPPSISNMGFSSSILDEGSESLPLLAIAQKLHNVEFDPKSVVSIQHRLRNPPLPVNIFSTGTLSLWGAKSLTTALIAMRKTAKKIQRIVEEIEKERRIDMGVRVLCELNNTKVSFIHGAAKLPFGVDLETFAVRYPNKATYNLEMYNYLNFRDTSYDLKTEAHIYGNGSINISNVKALPDLRTFFDELYDICKEFAIDCDDDSFDVEGTMDRYYGGGDASGDNNGPSNNPQSLTTINLKSTLNPSCDGDDPGMQPLPLDQPRSEVTTESVTSEFVGDTLVYTTTTTTPLTSVMNPSLSGITARVNGSNGSTMMADFTNNVAINRSNPSMGVSLSSGNNNVNPSQPQGESVVVVPPVGVGKEEFSLQPKRAPPLLVAPPVTVRRRRKLVTE